MVTIEQSGVDLFGAELPDFEAVKRLSLYVNSSEINKLNFAEKIEEHSKNALACGIGYYILGEYGKALENLDKAGDTKEKYMYEGNCYHRQGNFKKAVESFDKAGGKGADALMTAMAKTASYIGGKEFENAAKELKSCNNFSRVSAEYHFQTGRLCDAQSNYSGALENYKIAIELSPDHGEALFQLGYSCDLRGDEQAAIDYYKQLLKSHPSHVNALLNLAVIYEDKCEYEKALNCVNAVLKTHPNHKRAILFSKDIESSKVMIYDEEKERLQDRRNKILEIPISDFELSVRSRNCLKKMKIHSIDDLLHITEAELLSYKNFGETSLQEIKRILESKNLHLGMALEEKKAVTAAEITEKYKGDPEILKKTVEDMELSVRSRRALSRLGIKNLADLIAKTEAELLGCKNFGVTSLNEIKERLSDFGLSLRKLD